MPNLINYLGRVQPARHYDELELEILQREYNRACTLLVVSEGDPRRERVAVLVFRAAETSMEEVSDRVVAQFMLLD